MKKILILSIVTLSAVTMQAQIKFGVKAGANFYKLTGKDASDAGLEESRKIKIGLGAGAFANIPINEMLSVQPELLFSQEGNYQKEGDVKMHVNLNYLQLPVMVQYNHTSGFYAETGPQVGLLLSAKSKTEISGEKETQDLKDQMKSIAFAWSVGAGFKLQNGVGIGARYNFGLTTIDDSDEASKLNSSGFHIGLFYSVGGSKK